MEVAAIADTTLVVQAPEMGDEVQAIKAGLLEVADIVVVNKSDRPGADRAAAQLRGMLTVGAQHDRAVAAVGRDPSGRTVMLAYRPTGAGIPELWRRLTGDTNRPITAAVLTDSTAAQAREAQLTGIMADRLAEALREPSRAVERERVLRALAAHELDPYAAADQLLKLVG